MASLASSVAFVVLLAAWLALLAFLAAKRRWGAASLALAVPVCLLSAVATRSSRRDAPSERSTADRAPLVGLPVGAAAQRQRIEELASEEGFDASARLDGNGRLVVDLRGRADRLDELLAAVERELPDLRLDEMGYLPENVRVPPEPQGYDHFLAFIGRSS